MTITLRPATEADAPSIARIGAAAFANTLSPLIFPRSHLATATITEADLVADEITWRTSMAIKRLREDKPCVLAVEVDDATGEETGVLGFAHWQKPGPEEPEVLTATEAGKPLYKVCGFEEQNGVKSLNK